MILYNAHSCWHILIAHLFMLFSLLLRLAFNVKIMDYCILTLYIYKHICFLWWTWFPTDSCHFEGSHQWSMSSLTCMKQTYSTELIIKDTTDTVRYASYLDIHLEVDSERLSRTGVYDKRDYFNFPIVNFPFVCSNIPAWSAYGVYVSVDKVLFGIHW